jgi:hypothetical protein
LGLTGMVGGFVSVDDVSNTSDARRVSIEK